MAKLTWPADTAEHQKQHALRHVKALDFTIGLCKRKRTAIQAGGNIGLWPLRLAKEFQTVVTFEPEPVSRACLEMNVAGVTNIYVRKEALGEAEGTCAMERRSLGSHLVRRGDSIDIVPLDKFEFQSVDLLQLDIEGYELRALNGAIEMIKRCRPILHIEMRDLATEYGSSDSEVAAFIAALKYERVPMKPGPDQVFRYAE